MKEDNFEDEIFCYDGQGKFAKFCSRIEDNAKKFLDLDRAIDLEIFRIKARTGFFWRRKHTQTLKYFIFEVISGWEYADIEEIMEDTGFSLRQASYLFSLIRGNETNYSKTKISSEV